MRNAMSDFFTLLMAFFMVRESIIWQGVLIHDEISFSHGI